ncbi:MAG TPA: transcriptional repressor [Mycobacteriales bacterium]|nr:transcriptional repressor [Mycobacteriales bacterium]
MARLQIDGTTAENRAAELSRDVQVRVTRPRVAVLAEADDLLARVVRSERGAHRATVYRALEGLTAAGVLCHVHLDRGLTAYHLAAGVTSRKVGHLHAQCSVCGTVVDLPQHVIGETADRVRRSTGVRLNPAHVALSGVCRVFSPGGWFARDTLWLDATESH